jgi:hypothetical protein
MDMNATRESIVNLLAQWAEWHHHDTETDIGYPSRSAGFCGSGVKSFEDMCERADDQAMQIVDAAVGSLPHTQAAVILVEYGICTIFRFPRQNKEELLDLAMTRLEVMLRKRGLLC